MKLQNKALLTGLIMASIVGSTAMAAGLDNTVNSTAAHYGAEAYGYTNTINEDGRSSFVVGYKNTVNANNALVYGVENIAEGINSLVGGEYAKATGRNSVAIGSSAQALKDNTFAIGSQARTAADNTVAIGNGAYANGANALAVGAGTVAEGKDSFALGSYTQAHSKNNVAIGTVVTTNSNDSVGIGTAVTTNSDNSVGIGNNVVNNLGNSIGIGNGVATDFNTIGIGNGVETKVQDTIAIGNGVKSNGESSVAIGNGIHADGIKTVNIGTNVNAKGVSSIVVGRDTTVNGDDTTVIGANNGTVDASQSAIVGYNNKAVGTDPEQLIFGSNSQTEKQGAIVVGTHGKAAAQDAIALGNNTVADVQNSVALGTNSTTEEAVSTDHIHINGKRYEFAGGTADSTISVGTTNKAGAGGVVDYKRTITNVAAGRIDGNSTDAVNGSQLNAVINSLNFTTVADGKNTTVAETTNIDGGKEFSVNVNKDLYNMNSANFGATAEPVRSVVNKEKAHFFNDNTSTNAKVDASGISLENTDTLDTASYTMNGMTADSNGKRVEFTTNNITVGNQQIHDITAGTKDTDAVNVSQLNKVNNALNGVKKNVATNTADIRAIEHTVGDHEGRITTLESENKDIKGAISDNSKLIDKNTKDIAKNTSDIKVLDNKIDSVGRNALERANHYTDLQVNKGVAKASALAGLKFLDYNPKDKWSFAASVGHYRNANAVAVGAAYQPNENTMIHGGVTLDGEVAYNLGVSFKTGGQKQVTRHELEEQIRQLENNNIRMQEELNEIRSMLEKK